MRDLLPWGAAGDAGLRDVLFSAKTLVAAFLAYYTALYVGLERPYWSVITCYIVAQPITGALLSKGVFRFIGTVVGAAVAMVLVPNLVQAPELLTLALALWLGVCAYVAALDRTPRAYMSLLAGYSAIIVGFPTVDAADTIFDFATSRVQEIGIGIACVSFVHAVLFPRPVWRQVRDRLDRILVDAEAWSTDALALPAALPGRLWQERRRLANDLHDLHLLSRHLPYDMTSTAAAPATLRAAELQLGLLLPLASAVEDRIATLWALDAYGPPVQDLVEDVRQWIAHEVPEGDAALIIRAHALEPALGEAESWPALVRLSLLDRLAGLIEAHANARRLRDQLVQGIPPLKALLETDQVSRRALHRDHVVALRAALSTGLTVIAGCAFWILTRWPEGATAVVTAAIICALFSPLDTPVRAARHVLYGTVGASMAAAFCAFVLMPRATDFVTVCLVLSPFLLLLGWLFARPERMPYGVGAVLAFPGLAGLNLSYNEAFDSFANQALAQVVGSLLACTMLGLVRTTGAAQAARRLARAGWRELAAKTRPRSEPETSAWISRMLDRMVLLSPHLPDLPQGQELERDHLRNIRIGMALDDLQRAGAQATPRQARRGEVLTTRLRAHFTAAQKSGVLATDAALRRTIERALTGANHLEPSPAKRSLLLALVGLARNLSPSP